MSYLPLYHDPCFMRAEKFGTPLQLCSPLPHRCAPHRRSPATPPAWRARSECRPVWAAAKSEFADERVNRLRISLGLKAGHLPPQPVRRWLRWRRAPRENPPRPRPPWPRAWRRPERAPQARRGAKNRPPSAERPAPSSAAASWQDPARRGPPRPLPSAPRPRARDR